MDKQRLQVIIVIVIIAVWVTGIVVATFDGTVMLKATTPLMTLVFGWLFASKAVE